MTTIASIQRRLSKLNQKSGPEPITQIVWKVVDTDPETGADIVSKQIIWPIQQPEQSNDTSQPAKTIEQT